MTSFVDSILPDGGADGARERMARAAAVAVLGVATTILVIYGAYTGAITALVLRSLFFSLMAAGGLAVAAGQVGWAPARGVLYLLALVALVPGPYLYQNYFDIVRSGGMANGTHEMLFLATMAVLVVLVRLTLGRVLIVLVALALAYAVFGDAIPGRYGHGGYGLSRLTSTLFLSTEGLFGLPMGVAVEYIFLFALFGTFLMKTGTGQVFVDLARALTGRVQGGPGLSASLASAMLGSINGSAVANVVTTGTFTIPLMKSAGYRPVQAGAIEAAASSAGQILPPIMGAAAFLMAEIIGVPYGQIALAALVPALLYVLALMVAVRLEAGRLNLARDEAGGVDMLWDILRRRGHLLLPLIALIGLLIAGYTPTRAAVIALALAFLLSLIAPDTRVGPVGLVDVCVRTLRATVPIVAAVATAGVVIGVLNLSGLGLMLSSLILDLGGERLWLVLILTALASFVLGMGLPTSAAYLLLAVLVAPALVRMQVPAIAAHMFIFYWGLLSAITPPIALAAYAAAGISGASANATALEAVRLGFVKVLVPFLFITMPGLLMIGTGAEIALSIVLATGAVVALTFAFAGWLGRPLAWVERALFVAAALLIAAPIPVAEASVENALARGAGFAVLAAALFLCRRAPLAAKPGLERS